MVIERRHIIAVLLCRQFPLEVEAVLSPSGTLAQEWRVLRSTRRVAENSETWEIITTRKMIPSLLQRDQAGEKQAVTWVASVGGREYRGNPLLVVQPLLQTGLTSVELEVATINRVTVMAAVGVKGVG